MATITILPEAAALAGCGVQLVAHASGTYPIDPLYEGTSGSWQQYKVQATFAGRWSYCDIAVTSRCVTVEKLKRGGGSDEWIENNYDETRTSTNFGYIWRDEGGVLIPATMVDDAIGLYYPAPSYIVEDSARSLYEGVWDVNGTQTIVSVVATFYRDALPHGPILCRESDGVLICNSAGDLLWH